MSLPPSTVIGKCRGVVSRSLEDARIAIRLDRPETLVFNRAADQVWDRFDGAASLAEVAEETGVDSAELAQFAAELVDLKLFEITQTHLPRSAMPFSRLDIAPGERPQLIAREELAVLGGCSSTGTACAFPSSSIGNGNGNGPPNPPPGLNK